MVARPISAVAAHLQLSCQTIDWVTRFFGFRFDRFLKVAIVRDVARKTETSQDSAKLSRETFDHCVQRIDQCKPARKLGFKVFHATDQTLPNLLVLVLLRVPLDEWPDAVRRVDPLDELLNLLAKLPQRTRRDR